MINFCSLQSSEPYGSNCYLLESSGEYAIIDPSARYKDALKLFPELEGNLKYVLLTHTHFDHMLTINEWVNDGCKVCVGADDAKGLSDAGLNCYLGFLGIDNGYYGEYTPLSDNDVLQLGDEKIQVISTPGHTPGGVCYKISDKVFCGDTVFAKGGYGRCDLPGGDISKLEKSLIRLITHIDDAVFYPGHGESTTLQELIYYFM